MAIIKCGNCGKDASDRASNCVFCKSSLSADAQLSSMVEAAFAGVSAPRQSRASNGSTQRSPAAKRSSRAASQGGTGRLLISGNGKGNSAIAGWWLFNILVGGGIGALFIYIAQSQLRPYYRSVFYSSYIIADIMFYGGILIGIAAVIGAIMMHVCIGKTRITVFDNGIEGAGVGKFFVFGAYSVKQFRLALNQVSGVEGTKNSVTIRASNTQYKCYSSNSFEIQNVLQQLLWR